MKVFIGSDIALGYMRGDDDRDAFLLLMLGMVREVSLWICSSELCRLFDTACDSGDGKARRRLAELMGFVHISMVGDMRTACVLVQDERDPNIECVRQEALRHGAYAVVTHMRPYSHRGHRTPNERGAFAAPPAFLSPRALLDALSEGGETTYMLLSPASYRGGTDAFFGKR